MKYTIFTTIVSLLFLALGAHAQQVTDTSTLVNTDTILPGTDTSSLGPEPTGTDATDTLGGTESISGTSTLEGESSSVTIQTSTNVGASSTRINTSSTLTRPSTTPSSSTRASTASTGTGAAQTSVAPNSAFATGVRPEGIVLGAVAGLMVALF